MTKKTLITSALMICFMTACGGEMSQKEFEQIPDVKKAYEEHAAAFERFKETTDKYENMSSDESPCYDALQYHYILIDSYAMALASQNITQVSIIHRERLGDTKALAELRVKLLDDEDKVATKKSGIYTHKIESIDEGCDVSEW